MKQRGLLLFVALAAMPQACGDDSDVTGLEPCHSGSCNDEQRLDGAAPVDATEQTIDVRGDLDAAVATDSLEDATPTDAVNDSLSVDASSTPDAKPVQDAEPELDATTTDGVCTPSPVTSGYFDPDCVYVLGTFCEGCGSTGALIHPPEPDVFVLGTSSVWWRAQIRNSDGRLLYVSEQGDHAFLFTADPVDPNTFFPLNPQANDTPIPTPGCPYFLHWAKSFPDDGAIAYGCGDKTFMVGDPTEIGVAATDVIALGVDRSMLLRHNSGLTVRHQGVETARATPAFTDIVATRFAQGAFLVAVVVSRTPYVVRLLRIPVVGATTEVGDYALMFGDASPPYFAGVLDSNGSLYVPDVYSTKVTRYSINAVPSVYYDEANQAVKLHGSAVATGP